jgi:cytochrome c-type biogenesis protein CcmH/NrfG
MVLLQIQRVWQSGAYFREALQLDPDNNAIRGHLALTLFQMNKEKVGLGRGG